MHFWKGRIGPFDYLGHIISKEGVKFDPSKIKAITEWPKPNNISKLRGFLGLTGYYRRYVKNYAHKTTPLTNLLKKNSFWRNDEAKNVLKHKKTLCYPH